MDFTQLANLGEFIGGVAVLVTLIYLASQVRQGAKAALTSNHAAMSADLRLTQISIAESSSLTELMLRAEAAPRELSEVEARRFEEIACCQFAIWEQALHCRLEGTIDEATWVGWDEYGRLKFATAGHRAVWTEVRLGYFEPFQNHLEQKVFRSQSEAHS